MSQEGGEAQAVVERIRAALESADLDAMSALLDPDVRWGAPDDEQPTCQNRRQVLAWYQRGRDGGVRADVIEVVARDDRVLVGLRVSGTAGAAAPDGTTERWQVMTVCEGRVVDIRGFDGRAEAAARAGVTSETSGA